MAVDRAVVAVLVTVLGCCALTASAQTPREDLFARYDAILESYRSGDIDAAVRALSAFTEDHLKRISSRWLPQSADTPGEPEGGQPGLLLAAGMLHTDCAFALYLAGIKTANAHHLLAFRLVDGALARGYGSQTFRRRWYLAFLMFLHRENFLDEASLMRSTALAIYPNDAPLLLEGAALAEATAAASGSPVYLLGDYGLGRATDGRQRGLALAEELLFRALVADPNMTEAAVRLARVKSETGRREEAASALGRILASSPRPDFGYLANLFLGDIYERQGRLDHAVACYRSAIELYPSCQAARTALAHVLDRQGVPGAAGAAVRESLAIDFREGGEDPWWRYMRNQYRSFDELLSGLRREACK